MKLKVYRACILCSQEDLIEFLTIHKVVVFRVVERGIVTWECRDRAACDERLEARLEAVKDAKAQERDAEAAAEATP